MTEVNIVNCISQYRYSEWLDGQESKIVTCLNRSKHAYISGFLNIIMKRLISLFSIHPSLITPRISHN